MASPMASPSWNSLFRPTEGGLLHIQGTSPEAHIEEIEL